MMMLVPHLRAQAAALVFAAFVLPQTSLAATFQGEFFNVSGSTRSIDDAISSITGVAPDATFVSTAIDYPNGDRDVISSRRNLSTFLGADADSLVGDGSVRVESSVFRFSGFIKLIPGVQSYSLASDDGYRLTINNTIVTEQSTPRAFRETQLDADLGTGIVPFELIFYENFGRTGVEFFINEDLAVPSPVSLPAGAPLILTALGALALLRRRAKTPVQLPLAQPA